jgi:hypothetical protein
MEATVAVLMAAAVKESYARSCHASTQLYSTAWRARGCVHALQHTARTHSCAPLTP